MVKNYCTDPETLTRISQIGRLWCPLQEWRVLAHKRPTQSELPEHFVAGQDTSLATSTTRSSYEQTAHVRMNSA